MKLAALAFASFLSVANAFACAPLPRLGQPAGNLPSDPRAYCQAPWTQPETIQLTCADRLNALNAYTTCYQECSASHGGGSYHTSCTNDCLARICEFGNP